MSFHKGNKSLNKGRRVSDTFTAQNGGKLTLTVGDDIRQIEYIKQEPPIRSNKLARQLSRVSPLSAAVLLTALDRQPEMETPHLFMVLKKNAPLNSRVLSAVLSQKDRFTNSELFQLLFDSLPLPQNIWNRIESLEFTEKQMEKLAKQQDKVLSASEDAERNPGEPSAKVTFELAPGALNEDLKISISMDDEQLFGDIFIEFGPHGIFFNEPAKLNIEIYGLYFDGENDDFAVEDSGLYYVNQETGLWEKMKVKEITLNKNRGILKVIDAELPHFSRYAIGAE